MTHVRHRTGYCSENFNHKEMVGGWYHVNYIASLGDELLKHYDSWANNNPKISTAIFDWCDSHMQGQWAESGGEFYFEEGVDAFMFMLAWVGRK